MSPGRGSHAVTLAFGLAVVLFACVHGEYLSSAECDMLKNNSLMARNSTGPAVQKTILLWQGILLMVSFGAFALFIALIHRIVRTYIYYDAHLLDTFFDAGSDACGSLVAVSVVAKWTWVSTITLAAASAAKYGLVGHFWYSAAGCVQIFLFAIMAAEIRIKAPGAKTYLQVIKARFGTVTHVIMITFSLVCTVIIVGMVMSEGTILISGIVQDLGREVTIVILAIVVSVFTVVGGVGGYMYVAYFSVAFISAAALVFFADTYYDPLKRPGNKFGKHSMIHEFLTCAKGPASNENFSMLTFVSQDGLINGVLMILSGFSPVFVSQNFWLSGVSSKPSGSVFGLLTGALAWFAVPFLFSFSLGLGYIVLTMKEGTQILTDTQMLEGFVPVVAAQRMMGISGDFLLYVVIIIAVITTASSEVLAASSIIVYDIYQTYIAPFRVTPVSENKHMSLRMQKAILNEEYLEYDRRCVVLKHVVVVSVSALLIPITLIVLAINVDTAYLFMFLGVVVGSCVVPIALAITWHRVTGAGVSTGAVGGFIVAFVAWLVYSSTNEGGLDRFKQNTRRGDSMLVGNALALGLGGIICIIVSLTCGGCDRDLEEEEEWSKTRNIDNPIIPWHVKYAPDIGQAEMKNGRPHFYTVRGTFKQAEIGSYVFGVLFAVVSVLVWPALMLYFQASELSSFKDWIMLVLVWGCVATVYLIVIPFLGEIYQTCRQAYYNRMWARAEQRDRLSVIASSTMTSRKDPNELEDGTMNPAFTPDPEPQKRPLSDLRGRDDDLDDNGVLDNDKTPSEEPRDNRVSDVPSSVVHADPPKPEKPERFKTLIHLD